MELFGKCILKAANQAEGKQLGTKLNILYFFSTPLSSFHNCNHSLSSEAFNNNSGVDALLGQGRSQDGVRSCWVSLGSAVQLWTTYSNSGDDGQRRQMVLVLAIYL